MPMPTRSIFLTQYVCGEPLTEEHFEIRECPLPRLQQDEVLLETLALSVDPYMRGCMTGLSTFYVKQFDLASPVYSMGVARVIESRLPGFSPGDLVLGAIDWSERSVLSAAQIADRPVGGFALRQVDGTRPVTQYLGVLGTTGITAYFGIVGTARPQRGETMVMSGAAGGVGTLAGQMAKLLGARVIGLAGSAHKREVLVDQLKFDAALDYRSSSLTDELQALAPTGPDIYFDNVGGRVSQTVMWLMRKPARVIDCGQISTYDDPDGGWKIDIRPIHNNALRLESFTPAHFAEFYPAARAQLTHWVDNGKLVGLESKYLGFESTPKAMVGMLSGANVGKAVVAVVD
jgi:NADPH-dependent curcumin reductase CurA